MLSSSLVKIYDCDMPSGIHHVACMSRSIVWSPKKSTHIVLGIEIKQPTINTYDIFKRKYAVFSSYVYPHIMCYMSVPRIWDWSTWAPRYVNDVVGYVSSSNSSLNCSIMSRVYQVCSRFNILAPCIYIKRHDDSQVHKIRAVKYKLTQNSWHFVCWPICPPVWAGFNSANRNNIDENVLNIMQYVAVMRH